MNTCVKQDGFEDFAEERIEVALFKECGFRPLGESNEPNQLVNLGFPLESQRVIWRCCGKLSFDKIVATSP
jgi:hypothetical protein